MPVRINAGLREHHVLEAAKEWLTDRHPRDIGEKRLAIAVYRCFPDAFDTKENCTCGEQATCDECPTVAHIEDLLVQWEREIKKADEDTRALVG